MLILLGILIALILLNIVIGAIASCIISGRITREEELMEQKKELHKRRKEIKTGCILQSLDEEYKNDRRNEKNGK